MHHMNAVAAFLYGKLPAEVYIEQSEVFAKRIPEGAVCRLDASLLELKQALRQWIEKVDLFCGEHGMTRNTSEMSSFVCHTSSSLIIIVLYVYNLPNASKSKMVWGEKEENLRKNFEMKHSG